jgi:hypothetical protein
MQEPDMTEQENQLWESDILQPEATRQLAITGRWASFVGIVYLSLSAIVCLIMVLIVANLKYILDSLLLINGLSETALAFMMGAGKWLFMLMMAISGLNFFLNGLYLFRFGKATPHPGLVSEDEDLAGSFHSLAQYLSLTAILSVISLVMNLLAVVFYLFL